MFRNVRAYVLVDVEKERIKEFPILVSVEWVEIYVVSDGDPVCFAVSVDGMSMYALMQGRTVTSTD